MSEPRRLAPALETDPTRSAKGMDPRTLLSEEATDLLATRPRLGARAFVWALVPALGLVVAGAALLPVGITQTSESVVESEPAPVVVGAPGAGTLQLTWREGDAVPKGASLFTVVAGAAAPDQRAQLEKRIARLDERLEELREIDAKDDEVASKARVVSDDELNQAKRSLEATRAEVPLADAEVRLREQARKDGQTETELALVKARRDRLALDAGIESRRFEVERLAHALELKASEVERAKLARKSRVAALSDEAAEARASLDLARRTVTSPVEGTVLSLRRAPGDRVVPGDPVITVLPRDARLVARVRLESSVAPGARAWVRAPGRPLARGHVERPATGPAVVALDAGSDLAPGTSVRVEVEVGEATVLELLRRPR